MIGTDRSVTVDEVIALLEDAMAKNTAAEQGGGEAEIRKVLFEQAQRALRVTIAYWNNFEEVRKKGLVRVFAPLHSSLHDVASGAHPPFVFEQGPPPKGGDRPVDLTHDYVRALAAMALEVLLAPIGGMPKKAALGWLASELAAKRVVAEDGRPISTQQLDQWRRDIKSGSAPKVSRDYFTELRMLYCEATQRISRLPGLARAADAQERARIIVQLLASHAPCDAPRQKTAVNPRARK
jgi:hypothetical protein